MFKFLRKKQKGSLTVEAALVFPLVIITLLFVANILNICMVHLLMQQALNNTVKKISQDTYLVYRFAGEDRYAKVIDALNNERDGYEEFEGAADVSKASFSELQESATDTINSLKKTAHTFDNTTISNVMTKFSEFNTNLENLFVSIDRTIDKFKSFAQSLKELKDSGIKNWKSILISLSVDTGVGGAVTLISKHLFDTYTNEMSVPASKIEDLCFLHSEYNKEDGSFTVVINYLYKNPFSFVNDSSLEYSLINKKIRMANIITIRPFLGKNGTSLITSGETSEGSDHSSDGGGH